MVCSPEKKAIHSIRVGVHKNSLRSNICAPDPPNFALLAFLIMSGGSRNNEYRKPKTTGFVIASAAKQSMLTCRRSGRRLPRRCAPRNDEQRASARVLPLFICAAKYGCWLLGYWGQTPIWQNPKSTLRRFASPPAGEPKARRIWALTPKTETGVNEWGQNENEYKPIKRYNAVRCHSRYRKRFKPILRPARVPSAMPPLAAA